MGFTLVAMEGSVVVTETLNEYVAGRLDRDTALAVLKPGGWITDTQELVALLDWLRAHNASAPESRRVRLAGLDPQVNATAIDFLRTFAPATFHPLLESVRAQDLNAIQFARTEVSQEMLHGFRRLLAYLVANEGDLVRRTSAAEYRRAVHSARLLLQFGEFNSSIPQGASLPPGEGGTRDQYMADHLLRALQSMPPETRAVVWSHNSHVAVRQTGSFPPMGGFLRGAFGAQYYALATAFDRGAFQAQLPRVTPPEVREFTVPAAEKGSVDWFLARATDGVAIVDLRRDPPSDERIARWLQTPHPMHWAGAIFSADSRPYQPFILARDFDGLAMIDSTTRARPR
jgi:erythromycin esterase